MVEKAKVRATSLESENFFWDDLINDLLHNGAIAICGGYSGARIFTIEELAVISHVL